MPLLPASWVHPGSGEGRAHVSSANVVRSSVLPKAKPGTCQIRGPTVFISCQKKRFSEHRAFGSPQYSARLANRSRAVVVCSGLEGALWHRHLNSPDSVLCGSHEMDDRKHQFWQASMHRFQASAKSAEPTPLPCFKRLGDTTRHEAKNYPWMASNSLQRPWKP